MPFLEDFYYAGANPMYDVGTPNEDGYEDAAMDVKIAKKALAASLTKEQAEQLEQLEQLEHGLIKMTSMEKANLFTYAVSFAIRLMTEAMGESRLHFHF